MMRTFKWVAVGVVAWTASVACHAQQKIPLRPGEWALTSPETGSDAMLFCLNNEMWQKALKQNPVCTIQELKVTSGGVTYSLDCPAKSFQMKGTVALTFDGMEHMTGKALIDMTVNGKTTSAPSSQDYRWKRSECSPNDMNMHAR
jgi:hypothetical protein